MKEWLSYVFTTGGLGQLNLLSSTLGMVWLGIKMIQTEYRLVSVGVSVGPAYLPMFLQKQRKKVKPYLKLMASVHLNMDYGVSVLGGPLSVMQVSWAAAKFKATSYYSVHPLILSATHMYIWVTYTCITISSIYIYIYIYCIYIYIIRSLPLSVVFFAFCHPPPPFLLFRLKTYFQ